MDSKNLHPTRDAKPVRVRRKPALRVPLGASMVSTSGNQKRFDESFKRWQRTKAFHVVSEKAGVVEELRRSRDAGYF